MVQSVEFDNFDELVNMLVKQALKNKEISVDADGNVDYESVLFHSSVDVQLPTNAYTVDSPYGKDAETKFLNALNKAGDEW